MTSQEILKMDFYDFCGSFAVFMTDQDKIDWWIDATKECK
jgi:hypothetical protein